MKIKVYTLNAFTEDINGGNPAGVVLFAHKLSPSQMQDIAKKVGFSETAFVMKSDKADFKVRFFTPEEEVDLCGHATIGIFYLMKDLGVIETGHYTQETLAGILSVTIEKNGAVVMEQTRPDFIKEIKPSSPDFKEVCDSLGISEDDIGDFKTMEIISTGLADLIIPVKSQEVLYGIRPNFASISRISKEHKITGYHVFVLNEGAVTASCRNFAPAYGIDEESATGSASGALGAFLVKNKLVSYSNQDIHMIFEQGLGMNRPSRLQVNIRMDEQMDQIESVFVGGKAANVQSMEVVL